MLFRAALGVGMILLGLSSASANLITNGDFETGNFSGWTNFITANGTTTGGGGTPNVASFDVTGGGASLAAHFGVGQVSFIPGSQAGGGIFQSFTSGAGAIAMSADIAADNSSTVFGNAEGGVFNLLLDSVVVDTLAFGPIAVLSVERGTLSYAGSVGAGSHELRLEITRPFLPPGDLFQYVDNVNVVQPAAVSEPLSLALLGLGLAGLGFSRRKRAS